MNSGATTCLLKARLEEGHVQGEKLSFLKMNMHIKLLIKLSLPSKKVVSIYPLTNNV